MKNDIREESAPSEPMGGTTLDLDEFSRRISYAREERVSPAMTRILAMANQAIAEVSALRASLAAPRETQRGAVVGTPLADDALCRLELEAKRATIDIRTWPEIEADVATVRAGFARAIPEEGAATAAEGDAERELERRRLHDAEVGAGSYAVEGVLLVFVRDGSYVLMERCPKKAARHGGEWFIPGGRVEDDECARGAFEREVREELGVTPTEFRALPLVDATGGKDHDPFLMRPYLVTRWDGELPSVCLDHPDVPLRWVSFEEAHESPAAAVRAAMAYIDGMALERLHRAALLRTPSPGDATPGVPAVEFVHDGVAPATASPASGLDVESPHHLEQVLKFADLTSLERHAIRDGIKALRAALGRTPSTPASGGLEAELRFLLSLPVGAVAEAAEALTAEERESLRAALSTPASGAETADPAAWEVVWPSGTCRLLYSEHEARNEVENHGATKVRPLGYLDTRAPEGER